MTGAGGASGGGAAAAATGSGVAVLRFPLRGEWTALRTSHGTDFLGQRHAYDFVRPTGRRWAPFGPWATAHAFGAVPAAAFAAWDAPVVAAHGGRVAVAADGWPDRRWCNAPWDLARLRVFERFHPIRMAVTDWRPLAGNHVLVEGDEGVTMYAHLRCGSLRVQPGDAVAAGEPLGAVGHSGRSTMPHLHFQLMDCADGLRAHGIPCAFAGLEEWNGGVWRPVAGIPSAGRRIRPGPEGDTPGRRG